MFSGVVSKLKLNTKLSRLLVPFSGRARGGVVKTTAPDPAPSVRLWELFVALGTVPTFQKRNPGSGAGSQIPASQYQLEYTGKPTEFLGPAMILFRAAICPVVR